MTTLTPGQLESAGLQGVTVSLSGRFQRPKTNSQIGYPIHDHAAATIKTQMIVTKTISVVARPIIRRKVAFQRSEF